MSASLGLRVIFHILAHISKCKSNTKGHCIFMTHGKAVISVDKTYASPWLYHFNEEK